MEPLLIQGNIVLVAPNHKPDIVSKEWLSQNDILKEAPINFVHHQNFSLVDTTNYSINVVQQRVTITTRNSNSDILRRLQTIAKKYVKALPNVSYNAIGLNSVWRIVPTDPDLLKNTFVADKRKIQRVLLRRSKLRYRRNRALQIRRFISGSTNNSPTRK